MTVLYPNSCYNEVCYKWMRTENRFRPKARLLATPGKYRKRALN